VSPYEKVMAALKHGGFLRGGKPICPACPPRKRRPGFGVTENKDARGFPTVLIHCFRGCDVVSDILPALGLDPDDLFSGPAKVIADPDTGRYVIVPMGAWTALPPSAARTYGIALTLGYFSNPRSSIRVIRTPEQWTELVREAGVTDRRLRQQVEELIGFRVAHRCSPRGMLTVFRTGAYERCPNCGRLTLEPPSLTRKNAHKGRNPSVITHEEGTTQLKEGILPLIGSNPSFVGSEVALVIAYSAPILEGDGSPAWVDEVKRGTA